MQNPPRAFLCVVANTYVIVTYERRAANAVAGDAAVRGVVVAEVGSFVRFIFEDFVVCMRRITFRIRTWDCGRCWWRDASDGAMNVFREG